MNANIVITGATGFVGRRLIPQIVKIYPHNKILCLVKNQDNNFESEGRKIIEKYGILIRKVNLITGEGLKNLPKKPSLIIHLAAETDTAKPNHDVNSLGVINLYKALGRLNAYTHFIHIGTMVNIAGRLNCRYPIDENTTDHPTNEYTRTKVEGEKYLIQKCINDKFRLTILKPNTIYGKGFRKSSLFDMVINMVRNDSLITKINWPGRSSLIHADDVVKNIIFFSQKLPRIGIPTKYLLYSENLSISDISKLIHIKLGKKYSPIRIPNGLWKFISTFRVIIPYLEKILPTMIYNYFWRLSIIIDDVVWCNSKKAFNANKKWKPILLKDVIEEML